jgi:hypothetical protein
MQELGVGQDGVHIVAVFISFHDFFAHEPMQREVKKKEANVSAHDSRREVSARLDNQGGNFVVLQVSSMQEADTVLPLLDLYAMIERETSVVSVTEITSEISSMYVSASPFRK